MTGQHYRVIAEATIKDLRTGDLAVVRVAEGFEDGAWSAEPGIVRIERPVPRCEHGRIVFYVEKNETRCVKCGVVIRDGRPIERPVPTTDEPDVLGGLPAPDHDDKACYYGPCVCGKEAVAPQPPTREQINETMVERAAQALFEAGNPAWSWSDLNDDRPRSAQGYRRDARAALEAALLQKGGER